VVVSREKVKISSIWNTHHNFNFVIFYKTY
jgi:hypothetical protein